MKAKKQNFRDELRDFTNRLCDLSFDRLNDFQRSQWMTRAYLELMLKVMNPGLIPEDIEDFDAAFTDGPSDGGVDFIARSEGHVLIIQSKYRKHGKDESEQEFDYFCNVLTRLHPILGNSHKLSFKVREIAFDIDWEHDTFDLQFITLGKVGDNNEIRRSKLRGIRRG
ncbi:MAG: hypothetical protein ACJ74W_24520 [Pyrinomonadaceae bacterium]